MNVHVQISDSIVQEGSYLSATAYFRQSDAATTPTTVEYKIFNLDTDEIVKDWTTVTPASSVSISNLAVTEIEDKRQERHELLVRADKNLATQAIGRRVYRVNNLRGFGA